MKSNRFRTIIYLACLGIVLALYLLYQYYTPPHKSLCHINSYINCEASTKGSLSNTLGIPTGLWGLTGYIAILISAIKKWKRLLIGMTAFGFLFCLRITILELFFVKTICPVCIACQIDMLAVFILSISLSYRKKST